MEKLELRVSETERRIGILERQREADYDKIIENNKTLSNILIELKNITKTMETLANNWKEAINRSNAKQKEEHDSINSRIMLLEKNVEKLNTKLETETGSLEKELNERTIVKNSNSWDRLKWLVISESIALIVLLVKMFFKI